MALPVEYILTLGYELVQKAVLGRVSNAPHGERKVGQNPSFKAAYEYGIAWLGQCSTDGRVSARNFMLGMRQGK